MQPTKVTERIKVKALELLDQYPEGLRYSELHAKILETDKNFNPNTVSGCIWNLDVRLPEKIYKPSKGVFRLLKNKPIEAEKSGLSSPKVTTGMKRNVDEPASKNDPLTIRDCAEMARIIQELEPACLAAFNVRSANELKWEWGKEPSPWSIPEIMRFIYGSIEFGFVLGDYEMTDLVDLKRINRDPQGTVGRMGISDLRWFIHTVQRSDKWADCYASPILECLASGALQLAGKRLAEFPVILSAK